MFSFVVLPCLTGAALFRGRKPDLFLKLLATINCRLYSSLFVSRRQQYGTPTYTFSFHYR